VPPALADRWCGAGGIAALLPTTLSSAPVRDTAADPTPAATSDDIAAADDARGGTRVLVAGAVECPSTAAPAPAPEALPYASSADMTSISSFELTSPSATTSTLASGSALMTPCSCGSEMLLRRPAPAALSDCRASVARQ